jgi:hypothetical protein
MNVPFNPKPRRVSRVELHALVWKEPMIRLAEKFGITGTGLAKICARLAVPLPAARLLGEKGGRQAGRHPQAPGPRGGHSGLGRHSADATPNRAACGSHRYGSDGRGDCLCSYRA